MIGRRIGSYRIVELLGEGGMGVVYRAVDERLDRSVALKFLARELTSDSAAKERFLIEARAASRLDHANVCTVYEAGENEDGDAYLAMAFYEGETLQRKLARGPLPLAEAVDVALQVARALERAHQADIVHRDVKPGNVMITDHGEVKLLDFGLARLRDGAQLTREGTTLGTPAYMAPEQVRGGRVGPPADVWALTVVLYEMLTGRPPFGRAPDSTPAMILHEEPPPLSAHRPEVPEALEAVVARGLAKDPRKRHPSGAALREALEAVRRELDASRAATLTALPASSTTGRLRRLLLAVGVVVVAAGVGWWTFVRGRPEPNLDPAGAGETAFAVESAIAVLPFEVRGDPEWSYLEEGMVDLLSTKLDGAGELRAADPNAVLAAARREGSELPRPDRARRVAEHLGSGLFVLGDIVSVGEDLHVTASLYELDRTAAVARATVQGRGEELFRLIDELTSDLLAEHFAGPGLRVARTAALTSESLPAVKSYLQGESLFRSGRFAEALAAFQQAVAEDPDFALAWYRVSVAAEWATRLQLIGPAAERALALASRLSDRDRRLLEARALARNGDVGEAERLYRSLVRAYPDEMEAWSQLGEVLSHYRFRTGRSLTESRPAWERVLELEPSNVSALWHLARVAAAEGRRQELDRIMRSLLPITPESERRLEMRALWIYGTGERAGEAELLRDLAESEDRVVWLAAWNVALATDELAGCDRIVEVLDDPSRSPWARSWAQATQAALALARGRLDAARSELREVRARGVGVGLELAVPILAAPFVPWEETELEALHAALVDWVAAGTPPADPASPLSPHDPWHEEMRWFGLGMLEAALGDPAALDRAEALEATGERFAGDLARTVRGYLALLDGRGEAAVEELGEIDLKQPEYNYNDAISSPYFAATLPRFLLAQALIEAGRDREALPLLRSFGETSLADRAFEPPALILAGEVLVRLGRPEQAAASLRRALTLWVDAEPELAPWVERARSALAEASRASDSPPPEAAAGE